MARIALLSDIHGNAVALKRVLREVAKEGVDSVICLGDVVGYGPAPAECVELVYDHCDVCVLGNHDEAVLVDGTEERFNDRARAALDYTRGALDDWHLTMLKLMPYRATRSGVAFAHGSFGKARFDYLYTAQAASRSFAGFTERFGVVGHTHLPSVFTCVDCDADGPVDIGLLALEGTTRMNLRPDRRAILNPGSVGQPRDRNPDAAWGLLDTEEGWFEVRRLSYNVREVGAQMSKVGLPEFHAERLKVGA